MVISCPGVQRIKSLRIYSFGKFRLAVFASTLPHALTPSAKNFMSEGASAAVPMVVIALAYESGERKW
jgi:hypothetical protein